MNLTNWLKPSISFFICLLFNYPLPVVAHGPGLEKINDITEQIAMQAGQPLSQAQLYVTRGKIFQDNHHWQEAMEDFDTAALLDPEYVEFDLDRARLSHIAGEHIRALDFINLYLLRHEETTEALLIQARSFRALSQLNNAVASYEAALSDLSRIDGRPSPEWFIEFADVLELTGNKLKALAVLRAGIDQLGPVNVFQVKATDLEIELGDFNSALSRVDQILSEAQRKDLWLTRRADILSQMGQEKEAQKTYQQALAALQRLPLRIRNQTASKDLADSLQARIKD